MSIKNDRSIVGFYFCIPDQFIKKVEITSRLQIRFVTSYIIENTDQYWYIYNGAIINCNSTLAEIGISGNDVILAIHKNNNENNVFFNMNLSLKIQKLQNDRFFERKLILWTNNKLDYEHSRINDFKYMKTEGSHKIYKKKIRNLFLKKSNENENQDDFDLNINYQPLIAPCTEAMPILW